MKHAPVWTDLEHRALTPEKKPTLREIRRHLREQAEGEGAKKRERFRAELFALFASHDSLESPKRKALTLARKTAFTFPHVLAPERPEGGESQWTVLQHVHAIVHPLLVQLLAGEPVSLQPLAECERSSVSLTPSGRVLLLSGNESLQEEMVVELWRMLRSGKVFPLRRCAFCETKVFVPVRKQKYCSAPCRSQSNEAGRDKDERREYMRQLMEDRRKLRGLK